MPVTPPSAITVPGCKVWNISTSSIILKATAVENKKIGFIIIYYFNIQWNLFKLDYQLRKKTQVSKTQLVPPHK